MQIFETPGKAGRIGKDPEKAAEFGVGPEKREVKIGAEVFYDSLIDPNTHTKEKEDLLRDARLLVMSCENIDDIPYQKMTDFKENYMSERADMFVDAFLQTVIDKQPH